MPERADRAEGLFFRLSRGYAINREGTYIKTEWQRVGSKCISARRLSILSIKRFEKAGWWSIARVEIMRILGVSMVAI